jgi:hypothetical protein
MADSLEWVALRLALVDCEFIAHAPPELVAQLSELGARLTRAAVPPESPPAERPAQSGAKG